MSECILINTSVSQSFTTHLCAHLTGGTLLVATSGIIEEISWCNISV